MTGRGVNAVMGGGAECLGPGLAVPRRERTRVNARIDLPIRKCVPCIDHGHDDARMRCGELVMQARSHMECGASVESAEAWLAMRSSQADKLAPRVRPKWWFGVLWVGAFVLPIAVQGVVLSLWQGSGGGVEIGTNGATVFVFLSAIGTGLLVRPYVPRPLFWTMGPIASWGLLYWFGVEAGWFILPLFLGPAIYLLVLPALGCLAAAIQVRAFVISGNALRGSARARSWRAFSALTWLAMVLAPFVTQGYSKDLVGPFTMNLATWLVVAFTGGAVSCAGILRILHKVSDDADDGAVQSPP